MINKFTIIILMMLSANALAQQVTPAQVHKQTPDSSASKPAMPKANNPKWTYKIIDAPNKTFCYDIYADGILKIHQPNIPAVPGNDGFKTKADAVKVAQLVIKKIKKGEMPPTVTVEEMKKMKVIK